MIQIIYHPVNTTHLRGACDIGEYACVVYLDLKASDTVNHDILLNKMKHYGIKETSNNWFRSFLTGRKQYTTVGNANSTLQNIMYGVPQGSVLGPNLLLIKSSLKKIIRRVNHDL